jgi:hypothetical protein
LAKLLLTNGIGCIIRFDVIYANHMPARERHATRISALTDGGQVPLCMSEIAAEIGAPARLSHLIKSSFEKRKAAVCLEKILIAPGVENLRL